MKKSLVLVGFMGTGKSVVGRRLAHLFSLQFVDTDRQIETRLGKTVSQLFSEEGEKRFRELESDAISDSIAQGPQVISTGGGAVLSEGNRTLLSEKGIVVWLTARPERILERVKRRPGERPLLNVGEPLVEINRLLKEREPYYKIAAISVDTSDLTVPEVVSQIQRKVLEIEGSHDSSSLG
jgi:shikimate kinase